MTIQDLMPYSQLIATVFSFIYFLGRYKSMFDEHDKILDKHEKAIDAMLIRLDAMNGRVNYIDGFMQAKDVK